MIIRNCYRILGVAANTPLVEVRRRYRALARQHHPDHHPDNPEAAFRFRQLAEAYEISSKPAAALEAPPKISGAPGFLKMMSGFKTFLESQAIRPVCGSLPGRLSLRFADLPCGRLRGTQAVIQVDRNFACRPCRGTGLRRGAATPPAPPAGAAAALITDRECCASGRTAPTAAAAARLSTRLAIIAMAGAPLPANGLIGCAFPRESRTALACASTVREG